MNIELYEFRKRVGPEVFQKILTLAVSACISANLIDNKLAHFDLTPQEASAHRWSPYERAVIVTQALIRYLELVWAGERPTEDLPQSLKILAAEIALETLPHKSLNNVKSERLLESVESWQEKAENQNPTWQEATEELAITLLSEEPMPKIFPQEENLTPEESTQPIGDDKQSKSCRQDIYRQETEIQTEGQVLDVPELECQSQKTLLVKEADDDQANRISDPQVTETQLALPEAQKEPLEEVRLAELGREIQPTVLSINGVINEATKELIRAHLATLSKKIIASLPHTRGDSDARVGRTTNYTWFCGYLIGFVVDDAHQVITAVVLGAGNTRQAHLFQPAIEAHIERVGIPAEVAADSAFDDHQIHLFLDEKEIIGHVTSREHSKPRDGGFGTDRVTWQNDIPICPDNKPLEAIGKVKKEGSQTWQGTACSECKLYSRCYPSGEGKAKRFTLKAEEHQRWQQNRQHNQTEEYKTAQNARFVSEGRFGLAKNNHKVSRAPYRSDNYNMIGVLMAAIVMNFRILAHKFII